MITPALACAAAHPLLPELLCSRLDGHAGLHASDGQDAWADTPDNARKDER